MFIGLLLLFSDSFGLKAMGFLAVAVGAILIYWVYQYNLDVGEYLVLNLNSGINVYLYIKNHDFIINSNFAHRF